MAFVHLRKGILMSINDEFDRIMAGSAGFDDGAEEVVVKFAGDSSDGPAVVFEDVAAKIGDGLLDLSVPWTRVWHDVVEAPGIFPQGVKWAFARGGYLYAAGRLFYMEPEVVRLAILQRFHEFLTYAQTLEPREDSAHES